MHQQSCGRQAFTRQVLNLYTNYCVKPDSFERVQTVSELYNCHIFMHFAGKQCDRGWLGHSSLPHCYWHSSNSIMSYTGASRYCRDQGGRLATPANNLENEFVMTAVQQNSWSETLELH